MIDLDEETMTFDELEALRLADKENKPHEECAEAMGVSRPTFSRILKGAREVMATVLTEGKALKIEGAAHIEHRKGGRKGRRRRRLQEQNKVQIQVQEKDS